MDRVVVCLIPRHLDRGEGTIASVQDDRGDTGIVSLDREGGGYFASSPDYFGMEEISGILKIFKK